MQKSRNNNGSTNKKSIEKNHQKKQQISPYSTIIPKFKRSYKESFRMSMRRIKLSS